MDREVLRALTGCATANGGLPDSCMSRRAFEALLLGGLIKRARANYYVPTAFGESTLAVAR